MVHKSSNCRRSRDVRRGAPIISLFSCFNCVSLKINRYERLKRLGWSKDEEQTQQKEKESGELTTKNQISTALRLLVNYGPNALKEKGETKIRDCLSEWNVEREDSNRVVSFLKSNAWSHVVNVRCNSFFMNSYDKNEQQQQPNKNRFQVVNRGTRRLREIYSQDVVMT